MPEKEILGDTVKERDARELAEVRASIGEHIRVRAGLPRIPIVREVEVIPPVYSVDNESAEIIAASEDVSENITPIQVHIRYVREELTAAQGMEDPESFQEIKKKAA